MINVCFYGEEMNRLFKEFCSLESGMRFRSEKYGRKAGIAWGQQNIEMENEKGMKIKRMQFCMRNGWNVGRSGKQKMQTILNVYFKRDMMI